MITHGHGHPAARITPLPLALTQRHSQSVHSGRHTAQVRRPGYPQPGPEKRTGHGLPSPRRTAPSHRLTSKPLTTRDPKDPGQPDHHAGSPPCPDTKIASATRPVTPQRHLTAPTETARLATRPWVEAHSQQSNGQSRVVPALGKISLRTDPSRPGDRVLQVPPLLRNRSGPIRYKASTLLRPKGPLEPACSIICLRLLGTNQ